MQVNGQIHTPAVLPPDAHKRFEKKRKISWLYWKAIYA